MSKELLPCPFCDNVSPGHFEHKDVRYVICNTCGATCGDPDTLPEKNAYEAWNTRCNSLSSAIAQPVDRLTDYMTKNYPDAKGATIVDRVIDALETMGIALGMREIPQPYDTRQFSTLANQAHGFAQPAFNRNFCERCGKRLGGVDSIHTCTPPVGGTTP